MCPPDRNLAKTAAPLDDTNAADHANASTVGRPTTVNRKVVPCRSPLPARAKQVVNPGAPDMAKPKQTSSELNAAAEQKATIQHQENELEQQKISMLAEMELEEEFEEEEEERTLVRKLAHANGLDDTEDVVVQSEDICTSVSSGEDDNTAKVKKVAPKQTRVCFFLRCCRDNKY
jgi:hypothetical protein